MREVVRQVRRVIGFFAVLMAVVSAHAQTCGLRDNGDGTMTDPGTGLQIQKCVVGEQWNGSICTGTGRYFTWKDAVKSYGSGGAGVWRLITIEEARRVAPEGSSVCWDSNSWAILTQSWTSTLQNEKCASAGVGQNMRMTYQCLDAVGSFQHKVQLVRIGQSSGNTSASSSNTQRPAPAQNTQQAAVQNQSTQSQSQQAQTQTQNQNQNQNQNQQAQQQSQQAQQAAQQNQSRADQARQGQRKTNNPAAQAHSCIEIDKGPGLFGGFKNTCEYKVNYVFCNFGPKKDSWAEFHNCEKRHGIGADGVGPGRASAAHTKNTAMVYWFACRDPSWPVDSEFVLGKGIEARCH